MNDCLDVRDGTHDTPKYIDNGYPLVTSKNLKNGTIDFANCKFISKEDHIKISERSKVEIDDILFAMIGSIGNPVKVNVNNEFSIKNMALFKSIDKNINMDYLFWFLYFSQENMKKIAYGAVQSFVSLKFLREYLLPLPPLLEQKRIVEKIEELMPLIDEYEENWQKIEEFNKKFPEDMKKSLLQEAIKGKLVEQRPEEGTGEELLIKIRDEVNSFVKENKINKNNRYLKVDSNEMDSEIPENWEKIKLGEICFLLNGKKENNKSYPYLDVKYLRGIIEPKIKSSGRVVNANTNIILMDGENSGEVFKTKEIGYLGSTLKILYFPKLLNEKFYLYFLLFNEKYLRNNKRGAAIPHLDKEVFFNLIFPLPPLQEQKRIVERLEELLPLCDKLIVNNE